ncbi:hypothetical protein F4679DRAFT_522701 [Xylaria curta]|nr:hypothetical protein F4679DRAFT_522701 [Xylaria curta]
MTTEHICAWILAVISKAWTFQLDTVYAHLADETRVKIYLVSTANSKNQKLLITSEGSACERNQLSQESHRQHVIAQLYLSITSVLTK